MTEALTPQAVTHADVLRFLYKHPGANAGAIATALSRDRSNLRRDMLRLQEERLVELDGNGANAPAVLAPRGVAAVEIMDGSKLNARPGGVIGIAWNRIGPNPANPRSAESIEPDYIEWLAGSIAEKGLLQNLVVIAATPEQRAADPRYDYYVNAGDCRRMAIGKLVAREQRAPDWSVPCKITTPDELARREVAILENVGRRGLAAMDEARAFAELQGDFGRTTDEIAAAAGCTVRNVQQRLQLLKLAPEDQARVAAKELKIEDARALLATKREPKAAAPPPLPGEVELFEAKEAEPLRFRLGARGDFPSAAIELHPGAIEGWTGTYEARTRTAGFTGPLGPHPTRAAALEHALKGIRSIAEHPTTGSGRKMILQWAADIAKAEGFAVPNAAPSTITQPAPVIVNKPVLAIGPASLRYDGAIDVLRAIAEIQEQSVSGVLHFSEQLLVMGRTAVRRRIKGLIEDGLVTGFIDWPRGSITDAGRAQLEAIEAALAATPPPMVGRARASEDGLPSQPPPSEARQAAIAAATGRLSVARDALRQGEPIITDIRKLAHAELWTPESAVPFLELVLKALEA